jgi:hypothetical protein
MAATDLAERQLALIAKLTALEPELSFMGGYAEDARLLCDQSDNEPD